MDEKEEAEKKAAEEKKAKETASAEENPKDGLPGKVGPSALDEAKAINKKKEELLDREEKLIERKEKFEADRMVGGVTEAGQQPEVKEETALQYRDRIDKEISEGKHDD